MATHFKSKSSIQTTIAIVGILAAIGIAVIVFAPEILPLILNPTPTVVQPPSSSSNGYQPEIIPIPTETPGPTQTATMVPTNTPVPSPTLLVGHLAWVSP